MATQVNAGQVPPPYTEADAKEHQEKLKRAQQIGQNDQIQQNNPMQAGTSMEAAKPVINPEYLTGKYCF